MGAVICLPARVLGGRAEDLFSALSTYSETGLSLQHTDSTCQTSSSQQFPREHLDTLQGVTGHICETWKSQLSSSADKQQTEKQHPVARGRQNMSVCPPPPPI